MRTKTKKVVLSDFSGGLSGNSASRLLPLNQAVDSYNFDFTNGALTDGVGLDFLTLPDKSTIQLDFSAEAIYYFKHYDNGYKDKLLLYAQDKCVYCCELTDKSVTKIEGLYFENKPLGLQYKYGERDTFIFSSLEEGTFVYDGNVCEKLENVPRITSMAIYNERLYVTTDGEKSRLYFSEDFNPFNFNVSLQEGGYIDLVDERGGLNKVVSSLGCLYIFRTYGISRLTSYYSQENFNVSHLFLSVGTIYPNSVTTCDSGMLFLTADGIYLLTNSTIKRVLKNLDGFFKGVDNFDSKAIYHGGKFYLKCKGKFNGNIEDVLVVYDLLKDRGYIAKNLKIKDLCCVAGEDFSTTAVICRNGKNVCSLSQKASILGVPITKVWQTPITDLGVIGKEKVLKKIELYTKNAIKIKIVTEKSQKTILMNPVNNYAEENLCIKGKTFYFVIICDSLNAEICKPTLTFCYL